MKLQKDRQYELRVSDKDGKGYVINNLHIEFTVSKSSNNKDKTNKATIKIYNLSDERQKWFEKSFTDVTLLVGYLETGLYRLFSGQATIVGTQKHGTEIITEVQVDTLYTALNSAKLSQTAPAGSTIKQVIERIARRLGTPKVVYSGENVNKAFVDGYPIFGSPRQVLNQIATAYEIEWQVDDQILYIQDVGKSYMVDNRNAYVINETSGLIDRPYYDNIEKRRGKGDKYKEARKGVKLKILLNPAIVAGSIVKIDYADFTGFYKVERLTHKGGIYTDDWTTQLVCGTMLK